uniref:Uncharacterized protein n=1 Tax=Moniliophthora roreri TaxID=221103 RepID=A0A0W0GC70_MONRR
MQRNTYSQSTSPQTFTFRLDTMNFDPTCILDGPSIHPNVPSLPSNTQHNTLIPYIPHNVNPMNKIERQLVLTPSRELMPSAVQTLSACEALVNEAHENRLELQE